MNVEYFISKRLVFAKENKNVFSRPIIRITISAIALSVAIMLISLSVLKGFQNQITKTVVSFGSHIQISSIDKNESIVPLVLNDSLLKSIDIEKIKNISPVVNEFGLVKTNNDFLGIQLKGVSHDYPLINIQNKITKGNLTLNDSNIIISENISNKLYLNIGDKIRVYFPSINNNRVNVRPFYISAIYNSNMSEIDNNLCFVNISKLQSLKNWKKNEVSLLELSVNDFDRLEYITKDLSLNIDDYYLKNVKNIKDLYPQIFDWIQLQDMNVRVIIILMLLVSIMNVITSLLILILEKTSFIGILKSFGSSNWLIRKVFIYNSLYLVIKGIFYGNVMALSLLLIQYNFNIISLDENIYFMKTVPISFNFLNITLLNVFTVVFCVIMMILPTLVITKISPIKAVRFQ
tara:strand:+ start:3335 stop:4549 length:1215 start_codon:yes stop_codon:yes gene_type:complete